MQGFLFDLRQSLRGFAREPGFTALAVVALAIGAWLGNEHLSIQTIIGAAFIVASVSLILMGERPQAPVSSLDPRAR